MNDILLLCVIFLISALVLGIIALQRSAHKDFFRLADTNAPSPAPAGTKDTAESSNVIAVAIEFHKLLKIHIDIKSKNKKA